MQSPIQSARRNRPEKRPSFGMTPVPMDHQTLPEPARPHHPLVSSRQMALSGALRAEIQDLRHKSRDAEVAKSAILANLSHEFRTPLNAIIGFSELMLSDAMGKMEDDRHREYLGDIHASAFRLLEMVNVLLATADLANGVTGLNRKEADLVALFSEAHKVANSTAQVRNIDLELEADCGSCKMRIDTEWFSQAVRQILSEAIRQAEPGGSVLVRIDSRSDAVSVSILSLANRQASTGGSDNAAAAHFVSDPTGHAGECRVDPDLSIAKTIVDLHGGNLNVVNGAPGGLKAVLFLPRHVSQSATVA